ncbi:Dehydrogenase/reductase SDR family member 11 [Nibea albiflora]|uniref:Dehydrogenase/reductase SDR family member 11 n=1 Tax=Nibea albiflora TaxID=240163 RepID=A0ACB7EHZ8_NIBAL|nr:Dehydrogenase/reductase SDR family member 11 [Nibea albiflora]
MDRWRGRVALVTGASVGIGAAVAKELVRHGMKVMGCARDVEKIQKLAAECQSAGLSGVLVPFKCDLSNEEEILSMFAAIKEQHKGVDVCINNAGLAHAEPLLSGKSSGWKNMLDVNVLALSVCTREAYQSMKERNVDDGHIININSISPGLVETEFAQRLYCNNPDKSAGAYTKIKCLEAIDVADSVTYVLSAPPHVQIGDVQMRPVEQVS